MEDAIMHPMKAGSIERGWDSIRINSALVGEAMDRITSLLGLFLAMYLSELLVENIVFGGAVYIAGEVWVIYARIYNQRNSKLLPRRIQARGLLVFILAALLSLALVFFYPVILSRPTGPLLAVLVLMYIAQQIVTETIAKRVSRKPGYRREIVLAAFHAAFLGGYPLFIYICHLLWGFSPVPTMGAVYVMVVIISAVQCASQCVEQPVRRAEEGGTGALDSEKLMDVHAYRVYNKMTTSITFAINLCISSFICYMRFLPYSGFWGSIVMLCAWIVFIALITALCVWLLVKRYLARFDRPAIFFAGLAFWCLAAFRTLWPLWGEGWAASLLNSALMGASFACILSIIIAQGYEMRTVIQLGVGHIDDGAYRRNTALMVDWSTLLSFLLLLVMMTVSSFIMDGRIDELEAMLGMQRLFQGAMLLLPMAFVVIAMVYSLLQPLDRNYAMKLRKYARQHAEGKANPVLEARLKKVLVSNYPRRIALTILKPMMRPFLPCKVEGREKVDVTGGPVVFICNHLEVYGPLIAVLHSPFYFRPWVYHNMLDREAVTEQIAPGVAKVLPFLPASWQKALGRVLAPVLLWILNATDPIPVYRGAVRGVIETINQSVEAMEYDDNILLFPETDYPPEGVGAFFSGFVQLGKSYYRQTKRCTTFYPIYINRKRRRMQFGEGVTFDPSNTNATEKERIVDTLRSRMNAMAGLSTDPTAAEDAPGGVV